MSVLVFKIETEKEEQVKDALHDFAKKLTDKGKGLIIGTFSSDGELLLEISTMGFTKGVTGIYKAQIRKMLQQFDPNAKIYFKTKKGYELLEEGEGLGKKLKKRFGRNKNPISEEELN
ncbi:hypothetical protein KKC87_04460 [Patescibacteria group bacterium]|nr:hypothetical protein [Patescibacteria group bacterium]